MYLEQVNSYCDRCGTQFIRKANYLLLLQTKDSVHRTGLRAVVREVALKQWGHWMMGTARVFGESITVSGSMGNDGLPRTVSDELFAKGFPVPADLVKIWGKDKGHNGLEPQTITAFQTWALENIHELQAK